ncbi:MAG TPA: hypothetical protein VHG08_06980 [Longimicrobium sp.]|nr:hypothetical protein [Longimicrobium sp.]
MRAIEFSEGDYTAIQDAAAREGIPMNVWVMANLPLNRSECDSTEAPPASGGKPARTMADLFAGRVGLAASGGDGRLSENTGEKFTDILVKKRRQGRL